MSQHRRPLPSPAETIWHVSSYSGGQGECVEVGHTIPHLVPVRDSKRPAGAVIVFGPDAWRAFIGELG